MRRTQREKQASPEEEYSGEQVSVRGREKAGFAGRKTSLGAGMRKTQREKQASPEEEYSGEQAPTFICAEGKHRDAENAERKSRLRRKKSIAGSRRPLSSAQREARRRGERREKEQASQGESVAGSRCQLEGEKKQASQRSIAGIQRTRKDDSISG
jgi:hypothetical protein